MTNTLWSQILLGELSTLDFRFKTPCQTNHSNTVNFTPLFLSDFCLLNWMARIVTEHFCDGLCRWLNRSHGSSTGKRSIKAYNYANRDTFTCSKLQQLHFVVTPIVTKTLLLLLVISFPTDCLKSTRKADGNKDDEQATPVVPTKKRWCNMKNGEEHDVFHWQAIGKKWFVISTSTTNKYLGILQEMSVIHEKSYKWTQVRRKLKTPKVVVAQLHTGPAEPTDHQLLHA